MFAVLLRAGLDNDWTRGHGSASTNQALALFRRTTESAGEAYALDGLGGDHRRAVERLRGAGPLPADRRAGREARVTDSLGEAAASAGHLAEARTHHTAALRLADEIGNQYEQTRAQAGLARLAAPDRVGVRARRLTHPRAGVPGGLIGTGWTG